MKKVHATALSTFALATCLVATTAAGASAATVDTQPNPVDAPLVSQQAAGYEGKWSIVGGSLQESFEKDGVVISTGTTSLQDGLAADEVVSFGYVAGFGDPETGKNYAQLSGQTGSDVIAVRVISGSGETTAANLANGIWGAVWVAGDSADEYGAATIEFDTAEGTMTTSTDSVDVIAAEQRAAEQN
jgi:hypothetical protein